LKIYGILLIERKQKYSFSISASQAAAFFINNKLIVKNQKFSSQNEVELSKGLHDIRIELNVDKGENNIFLLSRPSNIGDWEIPPEEILLNPKARKYSFQELREIKTKIKNYKKCRVYGSVLIGLYLIFFIGLAFIKVKQKYSTRINKITEWGSEVKVEIEQKKISAKKRYIDIDITKGFAAFLMIVTHIEGARIFPFGNCGAGLFFFCSGINTILFFKKTVSKKNTAYYFLFFTFLLFFGGYTQIKIAHPEINTLIPEFLQFSALAILLVFTLMKIFKNARIIGYLFPLPFLLHLAFQNHFLSFLKLEGAWQGFLFGGGGFSLFPWSGFFLYGIFLFDLKKKGPGLLSMLLITGVLSIMSIFGLKIPVNKFNMSLSYMFLSLFVITLCYFCFSWVDSRIKNKTIRWINEGLALVGRNSLMFVYLHYFIVIYLKPKISGVDLVFEILLQTIVSYIYLTFGIYIYEKIKKDYSLLFPTFIITGALVFFRYANLLVAKVDIRIIDNWGFICLYLCTASGKIQIYSPG
jgi:hypothetical protein